MRKINLNKGSLTFSIPEGALDYKDNKLAILVHYVSENGTIKVVKDIDNGLRVFYKYNNNGECSLSAPAEELDDDNSHEIALTWSMEDREVILYINGDERAKCQIDISP